MLNKNLLDHSKELIANLKNNIPVFLKPGYIPAESLSKIQVIEKSIEEFTDSILICTSGTTGDIKVVVIAKQAFLSACEQVNNFFQISKNDIWALCLPVYHVGGLSILGRSTLSQSEIFTFNEKWSANGFHKLLTDNRCTLTSLVPTQVFDLVAAGLSPNPQLRKVFVSGGNLPDAVFNNALSLGWPIIKTFGMTETSAMCAVYCEKDNVYYPFNNIQIKTTDQDQLAIFGGSLFSGYISVIDGKFEFRDPKINGWFYSDDLAKLTGKNGFIPVGRSKRTIKILGELISLDSLQQQLEKLLPEIHEFFVTSVPDQRKENTVVFISTDKTITLDSLQAKLSPYIPSLSIPSQIFYLDNLPRNQLGKVLEDEIKLKIFI